MRTGPRDLLLAPFPSNCFLSFSGFEESLLGFDDLFGASAFGFLFLRFGFNSIMCDLGSFFSCLWLGA